MASHFTKDELLEIIRLKDKEGLSHKEIAQKLGRVNSKGEPNARAIMGQYKKAKESLKDLEQTDYSSLGDSVPAEVPNQLNELSKKQRTEFLTKKLNTSARSKHIFDTVLSEDEKELFLEEYFSVIKEEDSITSAEEQQLFSAILHLVLAFRAAAQDRQCYLKSALSGYKGADALPYVDMFKRDYQDNMKKYNDAMRGLKLSREQRLKDLQRHGTTFLDFAEKLARTDEQSNAVEEIMHIERMSAKELKRLQENGWLIGGGLPVNKEISYEAPALQKEKGEG